MTEEEIKQKFKETYPDYMRGDTPLSPYYDIFCYGIELMEQENDRLAKHILELQKDKGSLIDENNRLLDVINNQDVTIADLEKQQNFRTQYYEGQKCKEQLEQARKIIKELMYTPTGCIAYYEVYKQAEQFIKES